MLVNKVTINNPGIAASGTSNNSIATAAPLVADAASDQLNQNATTIKALSTPPASESVQTADRNSESIRVSSSIGRAASAGQLTREQALEIYRNIARFL
ncbi:hypothetical protein [Arsukibacterium sp.]|uniref:hypothetical protein n=1 Tax=Arsukibacterium sp. TaxID=1977258 RepID=UPI00299E1B3B|nr:hypothetical protein [Arsukibacterium sp.]MDX1536795.1 hypothetical protein [Arsukibacterium sp.]